MRVLAAHRYKNTKLTARPVASASSFGSTTAADFAERTWGNLRALPDQCWCERFQQGSRAAAQGVSSQRNQPFLAVLQPEISGSAASAGQGGKQLLGFQPLGAGSPPHLGGWGCTLSAQPSWGRALYSSSSNSSADLRPQGMTRAAAVDNGSWWCHRAAVAGQEREDGWWAVE